MENKNIIGMIDHTILKADASDADIKAFCEDALKYQPMAVCVHGANVPLVKELLEGSPIKVATVAGFPYGAQPTVVKVFEAMQAYKDGAEELDIVMNIGKAKSGDWDAVYQDIKAVQEICAGKMILKVIFETCLLTEEEKVKACHACMDAGVDFVKTSTGFSTGGATVEDVALMRKTVGPTMGVKAAGGIRDLKTAQAMIDAGANRIGTSAMVVIAKELNL